MVSNSPTTPTGYKMMKRVYLEQKKGKKKKRKYVFTFSRVLTDLPADKTVLQVEFMDVKILMHRLSNTEKHKKTSTIPVR